MKGNKYRLGKPPAHSFSPGHNTWNKGMKGLRLSPQSEFKKGQRPINARPVGSTRVQRDDSGNPRVFVKVAEPDQWEARARLVWAERHGPIPEGMIVHHENRDTLDDRIENLQLITRAEHLVEHRPEYEETRIARAAEGAARRTNFPRGRTQTPETRAKISATKRARAGTQQQA